MTSKSGVFYDNCIVVNVKGGLVISETNFMCGCHLAWLGHWLRRWARESLQAHSIPLDATIHINELLKQTTCVDGVSGTRMSIVELPPEDMNCQASALSRADRSRQPTVIILLVFLFLLLRV